MRLLLDEQISHKVAERLRQRGHDAVAIVAEPELRSLPDPAVFELAQEQGRALVTYNFLDFTPLARERVARGEPHAGLVIVSPSRLPSRELSRLSDQLDRLIAEFEPYPGFELWLPLD